MNSITSLPDSINNNSHHRGARKRDDNSGDKTPVLRSPRPMSSLFGIEVHDPSGEIRTASGMYNRSHSRPANRSPRLAASTSHHSLPYLSTHTSRSTMRSRHTTARSIKIATSIPPLATVPAAHKAPKKSTRACCTIPIAALFVIASVLIAVVFAGVTAKSSIAFRDEVDTRVKTDLSASAEATMKYITTPLEESVLFCNQMKAMIETSPQRYACDDANPSQFPGNESNAGFLYDAAMYSYQREHLHAIFQMRQSKRYVNGSGARAGVGCAVYPDNTTATLVLSANGSQFQTVVTSTGELDGLSTRAVGPLIPVDVATTPEYMDVVQTSGSMWFALAATVHGVVETRYTYVEQVVDPSELDARWAVGVDHDMDDLLTYLLEGTPPLSLGDTNSVPTQVSGAHTTLYDMVSGTLLASTHARMPAADANLQLYAAGAAPVGEVNSAYRDAVSRCPGENACRDQALVSTTDSTAVHVAYRVNYDASNLHLLLVSSVPRDYFYADADQTFALTLGLSIASCVLVIAGCVALLVLIQRPLSSLMDNMVLAAELHNDRVVHTGTYLRDIARLSAVFDGMNQQLLIARSFVPEAVLLGKTEDSQEDLADEGSMMMDTASMGTGQHSAAPESTEVTNSTVSSGGMAKLFNIADKRVAVLSLNLVGFHALVVPDRLASRTQRIHDVATELLELAVACAHSERGVMDSFHGDHFVLTYNASRAVGTPLAAAVRTANVFIAEVHASSTFDGCKGVAAGASVGRAVVGTLGIDGYRRLSVVGEVYRNAHALQQAAVQFLRMNQVVRTREGCMVDSTALRELGSCPFHMQVVGCVQGSDQRAAPHQQQQGSSKTTPPIVYYALEAGGDDATKAAMEADGEWLYELDAIGASDPYVDANRALLALMDGNVEMCRELVDAHIATTNTHPDVREPESNPLDSSIPMTSHSLSSSGSLNHLLPHQQQQQQSDGDGNPAWALVRSHLTHHQSRVASNGGASTTEAEAMLATTRQCSLPWLLFKQ